MFVNIYNQLSDVQKKDMLCNLDFTSVLDNLNKNYNFMNVRENPTLIFDDFFRIFKRQTNSGMFKSDEDFEMFINAVSSLNEYQSFLKNLN